MHCEIDHMSERRSSPPSTRRHRRMLTAAANSSTNGNKGSNTNNQGGGTTGSNSNNSNNHNNNSNMVDGLMMAAANDEVTRSVDISLRRYPRLLEQMRVADTVERRRRALAVARGHWQDTLKFVIEKTRGLIPRSKKKPKQVAYLVALTPRPPSHDDDRHIIHNNNRHRTLVNDSSSSVNSSGGALVNSNTSNDNHRSVGRPVLKQEQFLLFGPHQETENWKRWTPEQWKQWWILSHS
jgi:hypothetical protein